MKERVGSSSAKRSRACPGWAPSTRSRPRSCAAMPSWWTEIHLHHPRHRRPAAPAEADHPGRKHRRKALDAAPSRRPDRWLEKPRPDAGQAAPRPKWAFAEGGVRTSTRLSGAPEDAERLSISATCCCTRCTSFRTHPDVLGILSASSATSWSTSIRTPMSPSISGCACWRRARGISAVSAMTTSRSMAGAAPRSTTSCASRRTFPAPQSSGWSAIIARPRISWAPPPA